MTKGNGTLWMKVGLLLLAAAFCLTSYNLWEDYRAEKAAQQVMQQLAERLPEAAQLPAYLVAPEMEMPVMMIDGNTYIGYLSVPGLDFTLPVMSQWSYPNLKLAPCRYNGSAYLDNLIIAGHNYKKQFGVLKNLQQGDPILFTDVDGNCFTYAVSEVLILDANDVEEMQTGEWDLTLFTCTQGGKKRVTVRCLHATAA